MQTEQKENLVGLPDCMSPWAGVWRPSTPSWEGQPLQWRPQPAPVFPFWRMLQDMYCCFSLGLSGLFTLPWSLVTHMATYLGIYSFPSFPGDFPGRLKVHLQLYRPGMGRLFSFTFGVCYSPACSRRSELTILPSDLCPLQPCLLYLL